MMSGLFLEKSKGYWLFSMQYLEIHYVQGSALTLLLGHLSIISLSSTVSRTTSFSNSVPLNQRVTADTTSPLAVSPVQLTGSLNSV